MESSKPTLRILHPDKRTEHVTTKEQAREQLREWQAKYPARWQVLAAMVEGRNNDAA